VKAVVMAPGAGRSIALGSGGAGVTVKVSEPETGGLCSVWEGRVGPGMVGAGPHVHRARDEFFYVLEGELMLRIGGEMRAAPAGTFAFVPRGTPHGFHNASEQHSRLLVMHHPAGFERYFDEMKVLTARQGSGEERAALAARFDMDPVQVET